MPPKPAASPSGAHCGATQPPSAELGPAAVLPLAVSPDCGSPETCAAARPAICPPNATNGLRAWLDCPWFILCLLFLVTAILGLPLLWISRGFSVTWKIVLSVVVTLYTALLLWGFWWIMSWAILRIMNGLR